MDNFQILKDRVNCISLSPLNVGSSETMSDIKRTLQVQWPLQSLSLWCRVCLRCYIPSPELASPQTSYPGMTNDQQTPQQMLAAVQVCLMLPGNNNKQIHFRILLQNIGFKSSHQYSSIGSPPGGPRKAHALVAIFCSLAQSSKTLKFHTHRQPIQN